LVSDTTHVPHQNRFGSSAAASSTAMSAAKSEPLD
jgi:hypothetical protein